MWKPTIIILINIIIIIIINNISRNIIIASGALLSEAPRNFGGHVRATG